MSVYKYVHVIHTLSLAQDADIGVYRGELDVVCTAGDNSSILLLLLLL